MRYLITLLLMIYSASGIAQDTNDFEGYRFYSESAINYDSTKLNKFKEYAVKDGGMIVFEWRSLNRMSEGNHSQAETIFAFEVNKNQDTFSLNDKQIFTANGLYIQACRCPDQGIMRLEEGEISGKRLDQNTWQVEVDVFVSGRKTGKRYHFQFTEKFKLEGS